MPATKLFLNLASVFHKVFLTHQLQKSYVCSNSDLVCCLAVV